MSWRRVVRRWHGLRRCWFADGCGVPSLAPDVMERAAQFASKDMSQSLLAAVWSTGSGRSRQDDPAADAMMPSTGAGRPRG